MGASAREGALEPVTAAKLDSSFSSLPPSQDGHRGFSFPKTRASNSFSQDLQRYSKIGMSLV